MSTKCSFCLRLAALAQEPGADDVVWDFPHSVAFLGGWQFYHGYCVLVSRRHATELSQLAENDRRDYLEEMCWVARGIEECFRPRKMNYELLGNQVPHLHWHLFPRYEDDPDMQRPVWLALARTEHDEDERRRLQHASADRTLTIQRLRQQLKVWSAPELARPMKDGG